MAQGQLKPAKRQVLFVSARAYTACTTVRTVWRRLKRRQKFNWKANFNNHVVCVAALTHCCCCACSCWCSCCCCCSCYSCSCCLCGALSIVPRALVLLFVAKRWRRQRQRQRQQQGYRIHIHFSCFCFWLHTGSLLLLLLLLLECQQMMKNVPLERPLHTRFDVLTVAERQWGRQRGEGTTLQWPLGLEFLSLCVWVCERWAACQRWQLLGMSMRYIFPTAEFPHSIHFFPHSALRFELLL